MAVTQVNKNLLKSTWLQNYYYISGDALSKGGSFNWKYGASAFAERWLSADLCARRCIIFPYVLRKINMGSLLNFSFQLQHFYLCCCQRRIKNLWSDEEDHDKSGYVILCCELYHAGIRDVDAFVRIKTTNKLTECIYFMEFFKPREK